MKKKMSILLLFLQLFIYSGIISQADSIELIHHAGLDTFDIGKYVLPDVKYGITNLQFNVNSNNLPENHLDYKNNFKYIFSSGITINNFIYKSNPHLILTGSDYITLGGEFKNFKKTIYPEFSTKKIKTGYGAINLSSVRDYKFYKKKKFFLEQDIYFKANMYTDFKKTNTDTDDPENNKWLDLSLSPAFLIGKGRIEDVSDAWHTIRILKEFSRINVLEKNPTHEDIVEIAKTLSRTRYNRIFDSRIKIKERIKAIDKKIKERKLARNRDVDYFTSLYDMFLYGIYFKRYSGSYFSGGLRPLISYNKSVGTQDISSFSYGAGLLLKYEYRKPLNQFWQFDFFAGISSFYQKFYNNYEGNKNRSSIIITSPEINASIAYYPSSRSRFKSSLNLSYYNIAWLNKDENTVSNNNFLVAFLNSFSYYVSPRARIDFNFDIYYNTYNSISGYSPYDFNDNFGNYRFLSLKKGFNYMTSIKFNYYLH